MVIRNKIIKKNILQIKNNGSPKISIITPVRNGARYIQQTIDSVVNQSYKNFEYIIIDGKSTDGTLDILIRNKNDIDLIISEPDNGIYDAMNKGIENCTGDIIGIIASNDWYLDNVFSYIAEAYKKNTSAILHGACKVYDKDTFFMVWGEPDTCLIDHMFCHPAVFVPKEIYLRYGVFNTEYLIAADYEAMLRYKNHGVQFIFIDAIISSYRTGGISQTLSSKTIEETLKIKKIYGLIKNNKESLLRKKIKQLYNSFDSWIRRLF